MEKGVICFTLILRLGLLLCVTSGENCPVNPDCSCPRSYVYCYPKCGPSLPKFAASSKEFYRVLISGSRDINQILPDTFQQLSTTKLSIENTGLSGIGCDAFDGITNGLKGLYLRENYLESVPSCSLQHVKGITALLLTGNHISSLLSDGFIHAPDLQTLYLDQNEIEAIEIGSFNTLNKLTYLNLDQNQINYLGGPVFDGLSSLATLYIRRNKLKLIHPKSFDGLESLLVLSLNGNEISSLDGTTFEHLINMEQINLGNNLISSFPEKIFAKSVKLYNLDLGDNQLMSLPDNIFQSTPLLRTLNINQNNLSSISPRLFSSTPNLQTLYISANRIVNLDPETFKGLYKLSTVYIDSNYLTTVRADIFKDCYQLYHISMKKNIIQELQLGSFRNLSNLQNLDLSENNLNEVRVGVFLNSTRLYSLDLGANRISYIETGSFESQQESLRILNLPSNNLNYKTLVTLTPSITTLGNLNNLDLSHNPIGDRPPATFDTFDYLNVLSLRNCNLVSFRLNKTKYDTLDLSANNLRTINSEIKSYHYYFGLNVSYNNFQSTSFRIFPVSSYIYVRFIDAQHNEIETIEIIFTSFLFSLDIQILRFSHNLISNSLNVKTNGSERFEIRLLDLSYNKFNIVTNYPIRLNTFIHLDSDPNRYVQIGRLNLSHNIISFVSPEAFLGRITDLDLSHNRIQVLGKLLPANASSSDFRTQHLDLSGNFIHQISSDVFSDYDKIINNINLAQNSLTEIHSLRNVLEEESFQKLYLSDNPLNCDCESFWLRQGTVPSKLDSVRCDTPDNAKGYMSFCYPLEDCSLNQALNVSAIVIDLCKKDIYIRIDNLQFTTLDTVGDSLRVNVSWSRRGYGNITGYRLETKSNGDPENMMTSLVHPAAVNYIPYGLRVEMTYNICISAQREQVTVSEAACRSLKVEATDDNITISKSILIGISSALGICVLCFVLLLLFYFIRLRQLQGRFVRNQTQHNPGDKLSNLPETTTNKSNPRKTQNINSNPTDQERVSTTINKSNPVNNLNHSNTYEHPSNLGDNSDTYETIQDGAYENCSNPKEDEDRV